MFVQTCNKIKRHPTFDMGQGLNAMDRYVEPVAKNLLQSAPYCRDRLHL